MSRSTVAGMKEHTGRHEADSKYSEPPVHRGSELPGQLTVSHLPDTLGYNRGNTHCATSHLLQEDRLLASGKQHYFNQPIWHVVFHSF